MSRSLPIREFSPTFLRNATAYGVSPRLRFDLVLNNLVAWAFATGRVFMKSDGSPGGRSCISKISRGLFSQSSKRRVELVHNQAFNVGRTKTNYRIRELAEIVAETVPGSCPAVCAGRRPGQTLLSRGLQQNRASLPGFQAEWDVAGAPRNYTTHTENTA